MTTNALFRGRWLIALAILMLGVGGCKRKRAEVSSPAPKPSDVISPAPVFSPPPPPPPAAPPPAMVDTKGEALPAGSKPGSSPPPVTNAAPAAGGNGRMNLPPKPDKNQAPLPPTAPGSQFAPPPAPTAQAESPMLSERPINPNVPMPPESMFPRGMKRPPHQPFGHHGPGGLPAAPIRMDIAITGNGREFTPNQFTVKAGSVVLIRFVNAPSSGGGPRNLVVLAPGASLSHVLADAERVGERGLSSVGGVVAASHTIGPGEQVILSFRAANAGSYTFVSIVRGQPRLKGSILVE